MVSLTWLAFADQVFIVLLQVFILFFYLHKKNETWNIINRLKVFKLL